jgi:hypothetical protein
MAKKLPSGLKLNGIAPNILLKHVENTADWLFQGEIDISGPKRAYLAKLVFYKKNLKALNHIDLTEYFHLCLAAHWTTAGTFVPTDRSGMFLGKEYLGDLDLMEVRQNNAFGTENYYSGQIAMEYIIASIGMESLLDIWVQMGNGRKFDDAFSAATGLSTKEFYEKFEVMHGNLYEGELATN